MMCPIPASQVPCGNGQGLCARRRLMGWESAKPSEGCSIVKGFGKPDVGQVMPNRDGHGLEQGQRGPPGLTLARSGNAGKMTLDIRPVDQLQRFIRG